MHFHDSCNGEQQRTKEHNGGDAFEQAAQDDEGDHRHNQEAHAASGQGLHELGQLAGEARLGQGPGHAGGCADDDQDGS